MTPLRILLVDDERSLLLTLGANLELEGMIVTTAPDGSRALELMKQQSFDLVLSDVRMPGMNGVELFREARKLHPNLPVILMTGFAMESLIDEAIREGAFAVLPKPFAIEQILPVLFAAVRRPIVLIIDADQQGAKAAADSLKTAGVRAHAVFDAESAIKTIHDEAVDVCVIELAMAGSGTPPLVSQLRTLDPALSFIALAGHDIPPLLRKTAAAEAMTWVRKPAAVKALAQSIATARAQRVVRK